ncbi:MAG: M56 family metallopeptidase [Planctomycetota bacterium]|nr:M56 family metallopeptidase [Planctomycetota bacterium]
MSDAVLIWVASNLAVSTALAVTAWLIQRRARFTTVAHLLWITALVKLVTPPLYRVPVLAAQTDDAGVARPAPAVVDPGVDLVPAAQASVLTVDAWTFATCAWLLGSACVLAWSLQRVARFDRLLRSSSLVAPASLESQLQSLCDRLDLPAPPALRLTTARIPPLVWWIGGRPRVYLPAAMLDSLPSHQLRWVLAHELAHVRRGDHFVRWIEWLTCVGFWWNPVTWWARRNLRRNEELCCDALVLRTLQGDKHDYANSLLTAVEFLAAPGLRPPAMASEINSGGFLRRRFEMIVTKTPLKSSPRWLQLAAAALAALTLPLGVTYAQNTDVRAVTERLERAVKAGEMSKADMDAVLRALKQSSQKRAKGRAKKPAADNPRRAKKGATSDANGEAQRMIDQINRRARAAYESGEMTGEEARKFARERTAEIQERMKKGAGAERGREGAMEKMRAEHESFVREMTEMVKAGKLSREDMQRKVQAHRRAIGEKMEASEKGGDAAPKGGDDAMLQRLKKAVDSGRMTPAQAEERFDAWKKQGDAKKGDAKKGGAKKGGKTYRKEEDMVWQRLEQAVKNGDLTEEQAKQRYMEWEKRRDGEKETKKAGETSGKEQLERMRKRLDTAVERGDMTEKEAKQKWAELREQMGADKKAGKQRAKRKQAPAKKSKKRDGDR